MKILIIRSRMSLRRLFRFVVLMTVVLVVLQLFFFVLVPVIVAGPYVNNCCNAKLTSHDPLFSALPKHSAERFRRLQNTCQFAREGYVDRMTSHPGTRTAYCVVPKTSCTFWLSLFQFLHDEIGNKPYSSPLTAPRYQVHQSENLQAMQFKSIGTFGALPEDFQSYFRFMFVRDPYIRLWSAYIDKLFLLDFWPEEGKQIAEFFISQHKTKLQVEGRQFSRCYSEISFAEFVSYVVGSNPKTPHKLNEHWRPVEYLCNPCLFCPHLLGHMETFGEDSFPVLKRLNLTWILHDYHHHLHQMEILLEDNFRKLDMQTEKQEFYSSCTNIVDIARRLWSAFQMYGYIPNAFEFPEGDLQLEPTPERFRSILLQTYRKIPEEVLLHTLPAQRQRAIQEAYRTVPLNVLEKVAVLYSYEFITFDYEMRPYELFEERYDKEKPD